MNKRKRKKPDLNKEFFKSRMNSSSTEIKYEKEHFDIIFNGIDHTLKEKRNFLKLIKEKQEIRQKLIKVGIPEMKKELKERQEEKQEELKKEQQELQKQLKELQEQEGNLKEEEDKLIERQKELQAKSHVIWVLHPEEFVEICKITEIDETHLLKAIGNKASDVYDFLEEHTVDTYDETKHDIKRLINSIQEVGTAKVEYEGLVDHLKADGNYRILVSLQRAKKYY